MMNRRKLPKTINQKLTVTVASSVDTDELATELWAGDEMLGEIRVGGGQPRLIIYPCQSHEGWNLPLKELLEVLQRAEQIACNHTNEQ